MTNKLIIENLQQLLAGNYALYLKAQNYHWNVTGSNFYNLHLFFEKQYNELAEANDVIAERIRTFGAKVMASCKIFDGTKKATDPIIDTDSNAMLKDLLKNHENIIYLALKIVELSASGNDKATEELAIESIKEHEKQIWMIKSQVS